MSNIVDIKFYRKLYPDLRFLPDDKLQTHYDSSGKKENRVPNQYVMDQYFDNNAPDFDITFYKREYTDVPNNELHAKLHYMTHGFAEGRAINHSSAVSETPQPIAVSSDSSPGEKEFTKESSTVYNRFALIINYQPGEHDTAMFDNLNQISGQYPEFHIYFYYTNDSDLLKCLQLSRENITYLSIEQEHFISAEEWYLTLNNNLNLCSTFLNSLNKYINDNKPKENFEYNNQTIYKNQVYVTS